MDQATGTLIELLAKTSRKTLGLRGLLRGHQTLLDVALPCFVVSNSSFGLLACEFHFLGDEVDARCSVLFFVVTVAWGLQIQLICIGPFGFNFRGCLLSPLLGHGYRSPFLRI
jgi:hypothetical protein